MVDKIVAEVKVFTNIRVFKIKIPIHLKTLINKPWQGSYFNKNFYLNKYNKIKFNNKVVIPLY